MRAPAPGLERFIDLWGLEMVGRPGGRARYPGAGDVVFVRRGAVELVLKTIPAGTDEARSAEVLAHWDGHGAVRLVEHAPGAVLLERARPGDDLAGLVAAGDDEAATEILCDVMRRLDRRAPADAPFRTVEDWGQGFARNRAAAVAAGIEADLIDRAQRVFGRLCATQGARVLLHGDLQHYNVVRDQARGWLAIDPKGVLGEAAYEAGAMLRNPNVDDGCAARPAILARRIDHVCARLGHPRERIVGWCFSQWMLSILWAIEDRFPFAPHWLDGPRAAAAMLPAG